MARLSYQQVVIANGASLSGELDLRSHRLVAIDMPVTFTAATLGLVGCAQSDNNATAPEPFDTVTDSAGVEVAITAAASKYVVLTEAHHASLAGLARCKFRSGTLSVPVNQGQAVQLIAVLEVRDSAT